MEEIDKGCPTTRMGVSGWVFLLVPAYQGSPGSMAVKQLCVCVIQYQPKKLVGKYVFTKCPICVQWNEKLIQSVTNLAYKSN